MYPFSAGRLAQGLSGKLAAGGRQDRFTSLATDTRAIRRGDVFLALRGERFDGHRFFPAALKAGAGALVGEKFSAPVRKLAAKRGAAVVEVGDSLRSLQELARDQRRLFEGPVAGITGSHGKTGTKNCLAALLGAKHAVLSTTGNLNNHIGLPLTLLKAKPGQRFAVLEMGMNHEGELRHLATIARPNLAVVTAVGDAHLEYFGTRQRVAEAKAELVESLDGSGLAVLNGDDPLVRPMARRHGGQSFFFGSRAGSHLHLLEWKDRGASGLDMKVCWKTPGSKAGRTLTFKLNTGGQASLWNVLGAATAALALGLRPEEVQHTLAGYRPAGQGRQELVPLGKRTGILDAYNASPQSMRAGLEYLEASAPKGRRVAALGDMLELGPRSAELHRSVGRQARQAGVRSLAAVGDFSDEVLAGFGGEGKAFPTGGQKDAAHWLAGRLQDGDWILFKGSHATHMEKVYEALKGI
jgi:UDP-N-acetylmuramoyl-tripeptide--D-alanyl-D-alanine ligase